MDTRYDFIQLMAQAKGDTPIHLEEILAISKRVFIVRQTTDTLSIGSSVVQIGASLIESMILGDNTSDEIHLPDELKKDEFDGFGYIHKKRRNQFTPRNITQLINDSDI